MPVKTLGNQSGHDQQLPTHSQNLGIHSRRTAALQSSPNTPYRPLVRGTDPLPCVLLRLGLAPPSSVLEDEKFGRENGEETYVAFISHQEVIWWIDYLKNTDQVDLEASFRSYLEEVRAFYPEYNIEGVTYDGWKPTKSAFEAINVNIVVQECPGSFEFAAYNMLWFGPKSHG